MFRKTINNLSPIFLLFCGILLSSCQKSDDYKKYLADGEKVYPDKATQVKTFPGKGRILFHWPRGIDARVRTYRILWNNKSDSASFDATGFKLGDTIKHLLTGLPESSYSFIIYSIDDKGNKSVPSEVRTVNIYGDRYQSLLMNRPVKSSNFSKTEKKLTIEWNSADSVNIGTEVSYTNASGQPVTLNVAADENTTVVMPKSGTYLYYQSTYAPLKTAIDNFKTLTRDSILVDDKPGIYTATGEKKNYNADGTYVDSSPIALDKQLEQTATPGTYVFDDIANLGNNPDTKVFLKLNADQSITVSGYISLTGPVVDHPTAGKSFYDPLTGKFVLRYKYTNTNGTYRLIEETWIPK
ncbi:DUF4998 domain-containing protein [Pedobacter caeni]|uniref:Uncharacterized protein n=1 Tax=Pedobacter caeni TaxID=288992 RepID=A0A1M5BN90_9SPHI|nr:DUF4998 domain-containing protein [Pedobacter caeni]SHF43999.1 protein of unknown function [Pedobacter caeni]